MQALFVHGMGRTRLSGWPLLRFLRTSGFETHTFGYSTALHDFPSIAGRLTARVQQMAEQGEYILIGHSLGGVLLRAALKALPAETPRPEQLFLLGSPIAASRMAKKLQHNLIYRALTGDCGQFLASDGRMAAIGAPTIPTTAIIGTKGLTTARGPFRGEPNDGLVAVSEARADWLAEIVELPVVHTLLPSSQQVGAVIVGRVWPARAGSTQ